MYDFNYSYAYGKLSTAVFFLAVELAREGLITQEQYKGVTEYIDKRLERVKREVEEYSKA